MTRTKSHVAVLGKYRRQKLRIVHASRGIPAAVDPAPIRQHIDWLRSIGFTDDAIGAAAGLPQRTICFIRNRTFDSVRFEHAARIRAVTHIPVPEQTTMLVPAIGIRRRIQALQAIGYSGTVLGEHLGVSQGMVSKYTLVDQARGYTWFKVRDVYEALSGTCGTSKQAVAQARRRGHAPPMAWEGLDIDDPRQQPITATDDDTGAVDEVLFERILRGLHKGEVHEPERTAVLAYAVENGLSGFRVAELLNVKQATGDRALVRYRAKLRQQEAA
ncbi:hypothetical protein [Nocardia wallacei]|uniref:hypothetical protein n=1 Tax=Nocardia wallacei TaxID=480035 RepID=UPI00245760FC|nr:hypothetical protein [Nocardia wallacei]